MTYSDIENKMANYNNNTHKKKNPKEENKRTPMTRYAKS